MCIRAVNISPRVELSKFVPSRIKEKRMLAGILMVAVVAYNCSLASFFQFTLRRNDLKDRNSFVQVNGVASSKPRRARKEHTQLDVRRYVHTCYHVGGRTTPFLYAMHR